jgi:hypothetical protein
MASISELQFLEDGRRRGETVHFVRRPEPGTYLVLQEDNPTLGFRKGDLLRERQSVTGRNVLVCEDLEGGVVIVGNNADLFFANDFPG